MSLRGVWLPMPSLMLTTLLLSFMMVACVDGCSGVDGGGAG
jgi:hypothetical protein